MNRFLCVFALIGLLSVCHVHGQAEKSEALESIIRSVAAFESALSDVSLKYSYEFGATEEALRNSKLPPAIVTYKMARRGSVMMEDIEAKRYRIDHASGGKTVSYTDRFSFDGDRFYQVYPRASQYIVSAPGLFLGASRREFYKRGTIFLFGSTAKLSDILKQESTRIITGDSSNRYVVTVELPVPNDFYFNQYRLTFDMESGARLVKIEGADDLEKTGPWAVFDMTDFVEILPETWFPTRVEMRSGHSYVKSSLLEWDATSSLEKESFKPPIPQGFHVSDEVAGVKYTNRLNSNRVVKEIIDNASLNRGFVFKFILAALVFALCAVFLMKKWRVK